MGTHEKSVPKRWPVMILLGLIAGVLTRLTDFCPAGGLWSMNSIATLFGFWMVTVTLVICVSTSNLRAAANVLIYLFCMNVAFYGLKYLLGRFLPQFDGGFQWSLFWLYNGLALFCAAVSYLLYFWNKGGLPGSVLRGLPVGGLLAETVGVGLYLSAQHTFLFQFLFDLAGLLLIGLWFFKKAKSKTAYLAAALVVGAAGYLLFYRPFL